MSEKELKDLEERLRSVRAEASRGFEARMRQLFEKARAAEGPRGDREMTAMNSAVSTAEAGPRAWLSLGSLAKGAAALAAACALAAGLVWMLGGGTSTARAYALLDEVLENAKSAGWVHIHIRGEDMIEGTEAWARFKPFKQFIVQGKTVQLMDLAEKRRYTYRPETKTLLIEPFLIDDELLTESESFLDVTLGALTRAPDCKLTESEEIIEGKTYRILSVSVPQGAMRIIIDPEQNRIVRYEGESAVEGQPAQTMTVIFDYPETGPEDIYALGVPRDAKIDNRVNESVIAMAQSERKARKAFAKSYFAIVYKGRERGDRGIEPEKINIVYKKNGRFRIEEYQALPWGESTGTYDLQQRLPADDMGAVEREISKRKFWRVYFAEPEQQLPTLVSFDDDYEIKAVYSRLAIRQFIPEGVSWPTGMPVTGPATIPGKTSDFGHLVGAERLTMGRTENGKKASTPCRERWHYNRERDWVLEEWIREYDAGGEWQDDKNWLDDLDADAPRAVRQTSTRRVVDYRMTPASEWYAARVVDDEKLGNLETRRVTIVHVDTTREIPDALFDPSSIESEEFFVPKEKLFGWHEYLALKEIDSREVWPKTPEEVAKAYWQARNAKNYSEMAVLWPGSGSWHEKALSAEEPTEYVFGTPRTSASVNYYIVPYTSKQHYEKTGRFNLKMILRNDKSKKGRWYITSAN